MKHSAQNLAGAALAFVVLVGAVGCSGSALNSAIASANTHFKNVTSLEATVQSEAASMTAQSYSKKGARAALAIAAQLSSDLSSERLELLAARSGLAQLEAMNVSAAVTEYARLEIAAIDTRVRIVDATKQVYAATSQAYAGIRDGTDSEALIAKVSGEVDTLNSTVASLTAQAASETAGAARFFTTHALGQ